MKLIRKTKVGTMSWKRKALSSLMIWMLILEMVLHTSSRELRSPAPEKHGLRPRRINKEKERTSTRLLRRLLQSAYAVKRIKNTGRQKYEWFPDYEDDFEGFGVDDRTLQSIQIERKPKGRKRFENDDPVVDSTITCCPQMYDIIEPSFGRNRTGHMVELYKDQKIQQRFYELICAPAVEDMPCRFLEGRNHRMSKCIQQHIWTYALVRSNQSLSGWSLDHIRVRSGCVCKVFPTLKRKKAFERRKT